MDLILGFMLIRLDHVTVWPDPTVWCLTLRSGRIPHLFIDLSKVTGLHMSWKLLSSYQDTVEADIVRGLLEDNDIPVMVDDKALNELMPQLSGVLGGTKVFVMERDFDRAVKILSETEEQSDPQDSEEADKKSPDEIYEEKARKVRQISIIGFLTLPGLVHLFAVSRSIELFKVWSELKSRSRSYLVVGSCLNFLGILLFLIFTLKYF